LEAGHGGILLMSHLGNWEVGARLLRQNMPHLRLMLYVGRRAKDQIEHLQKQDLMADGIRVVTVDQQGASAFDLVEGTTHLRSGGFVSMAGDMIWRLEQRKVRVRFLDHWVSLPEAPFILSLVARVPLYVFFVSSRGPQTYHFSVSEPIRVAAEDRAQRREAVFQAAQAYADRLAVHLGESPYEWYHFKPFLDAPASSPKTL
ncbi:MAG: lauroyl acyltransferase, partial [Desulfatitalea sp.]|nr:lauroyl acyltransferase [Desulfatitalea sp.]NNJ99859.1 lauroyl acyltransferase [Desulfatitalea sp.]